jgi:hypothetical protein
MDIPDADAVLQHRMLEVEGFDVLVDYVEADPNALYLHFNYGIVSSGRTLKAFRLLLEANLVVYAQDQAQLGMDAETGGIVMIVRVEFCDGVAGAGTRIRSGSGLLARGGGGIVAAPAVLRPLPGLFARIALLPGAGITGRSCGWARACDSSISNSSSSSPALSPASGTTAPRFWRARSLASRAAMWALLSGDSTRSGRAASSAAADK